MYKSRLSFSQKDIHQLKMDLEKFLSRRTHIYCRALKRRISLQKLPEAIAYRHDAKRRLRIIFVAFDILKYTRLYESKVIKGTQCYDIRGTDAAGNTVVIHLREEVKDKDRILYFISCF